jgi:hypothetical protein
VPIRVPLLEIVVGLLTYRDTPVAT